MFECRVSGLPEKHVKFFFISTSEKEKNILLDVLFEDNPYPCTVLVLNKQPEFRYTSQPDYDSLVKTKLLLE